MDGSSWAVCQGALLCREPRCPPRKFVHELGLLLIQEAGACGAVWVVVGEVWRPLVLGVLQAHLETSHTDSSVHLRHKPQGRHISLFQHIQTQQANGRRLSPEFVIA